jgi:putative ABC transport system permease protein
MAMFGSLGRRLLMLGRRKQVDRDLDDEMRLHLELIEKQETTEGTPPAEARATARQKFGSPLRIKEDSRDTRGWRWLDDLLQDLRYAARSLVAHKGFAAAAIATLAIGIGANTAIFGVVNGVVLRPLPFANPDRLVSLYGTPTARGDFVDDLDDYRRDSTSFDALASCDVSARYMLGPNGGERVMTVNADGDLFPLLGVAPIAGRAFGPSDPATVAVISEDFWKRRLNGAPSAIGQSIMLDDEAFTIIGVMPSSFQFPYGAASVLHGAGSEAHTDLWTPLEVYVNPTGRPRTRSNHVTGRLKMNVSIEQAASELAVISQRREAQSPDRYGARGVRIEPLASTVVGESVRRPLLVLFGAAGIVLLLACANVTNLSLVRVTLRRREVAVRAALGAGALRLVRQFLTESLLLALAGGLVGLGLAWWGTRLLTLTAGAELPRWREVGFDWHVFLFLLAACVVTSVAFGVTPAIVALRTDPQSVLQGSGGHNTMGAGLRRLRDGLVAAEVAMAFALAVGGVLLVRELVRLRNTDTGMVSRNVVTFHLGQRIVFGATRGATPAVEVRKLYDIADRVARLPGVKATGFTQVLPLQNWGWGASSADFTIRGRPPAIAPPDGFQLRFVTPGYFQALGIPIKRGRAFTEGDNRDAPRVILMNETLARAYFGTDNPVGALTPRGTIVGVVGDVRQLSLDQSSAPELYYPIAQNWSQLVDLGMTLVVSTRDVPDNSINAIRAAIHDVSPNEAIFNVKTMDDVIDDSLSAFTLYLWLMTGFAALALALAVIGTYGVMSHVATSRTREFAIRIALGAGRGRVTTLMTAQAIRLTAFGLAGGIIAAVAAAPLLQSLPVTVRPPDASTLVPVALAIAAVAMAASVAPALRAAGVDPMRALREE